MKNVQQLIAIARADMKLAYMLDDEGVKWIKMRYKALRDEVDSIERDRKVAKAQIKLTVATATADVFGDSHKEQQATKKAEKSIARTERYSVPLEDLDINVILECMPELYQQFRIAQEKEIKAWNPGIRSPGEKYDKDWLKKFRARELKIREEFNKAVKFGEIASEKEDKIEEKEAFEEYKKDIQPTLF
jgi:hypothetical protein